MDNTTALMFNRENHQKLMVILEPLMLNFPVTGFVYMELWGAKNYFFMGSDPTWREEYLMKGSPGGTWIEGLKFAATQDKPTVVAWALLESPDLIEQYCIDLGYRYGMNIYKREGNKIRLWAFNGNEPHSLTFFQTQKTLLENFKLYFNELAKFSQLLPPKGEGVNPIPLNSIKTIMYYGIPSITHINLVNCRPSWMCHEGLER